MSSSPQAQDQATRNDVWETQSAEIQACVPYLEQGHVHVESILPSNSFSFAAMQMIEVQTVPVLLLMINAEL